MNFPSGSTLKKSDFETPQPIKWCPGCGDHSVLSSVQKFLASENIDLEKYVFVSGIGCSSRFPYHMGTYGFHSIHGRAPTIATGVKLANPELSVWIVSGDGDALSIGGNHLIHILRRNIKCVFLLLNNRIYGLTKGQYSPTSEFGKETKSSPYGAPDKPIRPISVALGAEATFVARTLDVDSQHLSYVLKRAHRHPGTAFVEVYQTCVVFNEGGFEYLRDRSIREDSRILLEHGKPLVFGANRDKGLKLKSHGAEVVSIAPNDANAAIKAGITIFDETNVNHALLLTKMPPPPEFPVPMGVFHQEYRPTLEHTLEEQYEKSRINRVIPDDEGLRELEELFSSGATWEVS